MSTTAARAATVVEQLVGERLTAIPPAHPDAAGLVIEAFAAAPSARPGGEPGAAGDLPVTPVSLASITVEGFRGVGEPATLELAPGPGLTLVVGRNGCGKSSFAEALEVVLTGSSRRWMGRARVWQDGWRNLHHRPARVAAELLVQGRRQRLRLERRWEGDDAGGSRLLVDGRHVGGGVVPGWEAALATHRPLLSHNELGAVLEDGPTRLHDALALILGLDELTAAQAWLGEARRGLERRQREHEQTTALLQARLAELDDDRARRCLRAIGEGTAGLATIAAVLAGADAEAEAPATLQRLRELAGLALPGGEAALAARLRDADRGLRAVSGTDAERARQTARVLAAALEWHHHRGDGDGDGRACPVCAQGSLGPGWAAEAARQLEESTRLADTAERAHREERAARAAAKALAAAAMPAAVAGATAAGLDPAAVLVAAERRRRLDLEAPLEEIATHLEVTAEPLLVATDALREAAAQELSRREDAWRPLVPALAVWLSEARERAAETVRLKPLRAAEAWLRDAHADLRAQRFAPVAAQVAEHWALLRQDSNVSLEELRLEGSATQRRLKLDVRVDGAEGSALGVMSQGELNCLALSLFLPRAALPESPFRFVVVDDPVQAMDPTKVEGLARVLHRAAADRQVVVFTHDGRLPEAVRRLDLSATIIEVTRRSGSRVELRRSHDPVSRHIEDAFAVANVPALPEQAARVVPGLCRIALEAACAAAITRRLLHGGRSYDELDAALAEPTTLLTWLALVLFDDIARAGQVQATMERRFGSWASDVVGRCNRGAHRADRGDLRELARATERLAAAIAAL